MSLKVVVTGKLQFANITFKLVGGVVGASVVGVG